MTGSNVNDVWTIVMREIRDKKLLLLGAVICAALVLVTPLLPGLPDEDPVSVITAAALVLVVVCLTATPFALGTGIIARDLHEGRMSFYLARPVGSGSIWLGKTLAVILISGLMAFAIILIPTLLGGGLFGITGFIEGWELYSPVRGGLGEMVSRIILGGLLNSTFLLAMAQFWGLGFRTRSPWLLVDLIGFAFAGTIIWLAIRPFQINGAMADVTVLSVVVAIEVSLMMMTGNVIGLRYGGSDLQKTHRSTSTVTITLVLTGAAVMFFYSEIRRSLAPSDLTSVSIVDAPDSGNWISIAGSVRPGGEAYWTSYLVNIDTGEAIETANSEPQVSDDGEIGIIWKREGTALEVRLYWVDLSHPGAVHRTDIVAPMSQNEYGNYWWPVSETAPSGTRVAWIEDDSVRVHDLGSGTDSFSARLPEATHRFLYFADDTHLLVCSRNDEHWTIQDANLREDSWTTTGTIDSDFLSRWWSDAGLVSIHRGEGAAEPNRYRLHDPLNGEVVASYEAASGRYLDDGRFVELIDGSPPIVRIHSGDTTVPQEIRMPAGFEVNRTHHLGPSHLAVQVSPGPKTYLLGLDDLTVREVDPAIDVLRAGTWWGPLGSFPGKVGNQVAVRGFTLVRFDPETMETTPLLEESKVKWRM